MQIRSNASPEEIQRSMEVVRETWGKESPEHVFKDFLVAIRFHGGLVLTVEEDSKMVGIQVSIPAYRNGFRYLYSHITGIIPEFRDSNVGTDLKFAQRDWALDQGYELIAWTFDPAMSKNAYFNIEKLGVICRTYVYDFYGVMNDDLNYGLPTDRLMAEWWIQEPKEDHQDGEYKEISKTEEIPSGNQGVARVSVSTVRDLTELKQKSMKEAREVKLRLKDLFPALFREGFVVTGYDKSNYRYLLRRDSSIARKHPANIFL